jgi:hypothetical protein
MFTPFLSYVGATAEGDRVRIAPQAFYYYKSFSAFGEYVHTAQPIRRGDVSADIDHPAWNVTASYVLTGEKATDVERTVFDGNPDGPRPVEHAVAIRAQLFF